MLKLVFCVWIICCVLVLDRLFNVLLFGICSMVLVLSWFMLLLMNVFGLVWYSFISIWFREILGVCVLFVIFDKVLLGLMVYLLVVVVVLVVGLGVGLLMMVGG